MSGIERPARYEPIYARVGASGFLEQIPRPDPERLNWITPGCPCATCTPGGIDAAARISGLEREVEALTWALEASSAISRAGLGVAAAIVAARESGCPDANPLNGDDAAIVSSADTHLGGAS